jgi:hypothetical protein
VPTDGHTEVYVTDPAKVPAEALRTWLQVPVMMNR